MFLLLAVQYHGNPVAALQPFHPTGMVFSPYAPLQNFTNLTLTSPNAQLGGAFGYSVAASGNIVVVGAIFREEHAYVFDAKNGALMNTLTSPDSQPFGGFGVSVAASGNIVVVGANLETANGQSEAGHAYVFNATNGSLISTLASPNAQPGGAFGYSVAASDGIVVIGAPFEIGHTHTGHAYVFNAITGNLISTLTSSNTQPEGAFGYSVAAFGSILVIGAQTETDDNVPLAGHAYVVNATTGSLISTLSSPNPQLSGLFGLSVATNGNIVAVGAPFETANGRFDAGHVYTFNAITGSLIRTITSPNAEVYGWFGWAVGIRGNLVVVSAHSETVNGQFSAGRVYTFNAATSSLINTLASRNAQLGYLFGQSVAVSSNVLVIGAPYETVNGQPVAGHAYVFRPPPLKPDPS